MDFLEDGLVASRHGVVGRSGAGMLGLWVVIVDVKANVNLSSTFSVVPVFTTTTRDVAMPVAGGNSASASSVAKAAGTFGARWLNEATTGRAAAMHA